MINAGSWADASTGRTHSFRNPAFKLAVELRYRVYCLEHNFLSADDYPEGTETDEHDESAAHFYAFDEDRELVGYVRLVRADQERMFPFQHKCNLSVRPGELPPAPYSAEISRLMVRSDYRRQRGHLLSNVTAEQNIAALAGERRGEAPLVLLCLYRQMYAYSRANNIYHWYAAMERPLARSLQFLNFSFRQIGPESNYYGPVAPYMADLRELEAEGDRHRPALWAWLRSNDRRAPPGIRTAPGRLNLLEAAEAFS